MANPRRAVGQRLLPFLSQPQGLHVPLDADVATSEVEPPVPSKRGAQGAA